MNHEIGGSEKLPQWRFSLRLLLGMVGLLAVALAVWLQHREAAESSRLAEQNRQLREQLAGARFDLELERIAFQLKVPTEALYHGYLPVSELNRLRWEALEKAGAGRDFVPLVYLYEHQRSSPMLHSSPLSKQDLSHWKELHGSYWEGYAINHADDGAARLVARLRHAADFRRHLLDDPKTVDEFLGPLLLRMVKASEPRARYAAIEALLLLGDRSEAVLDVLRQSLLRPTELPPRLDLIERARYYSWDPAAARRLMQEFQLE